MNHWLMKTEPDAFSIDDLARVGVEPWDGIRNYQARNFIRDSMKLDDLVFIYHSRVDPPAVVGIGRVASAPYPDPKQFDPDAKYYDAGSVPTNPRWYLVEIAYVGHLPCPVSLGELKQAPGLEHMMVTRKGSRLSIQPVTDDEWQIVLQLGGWRA